ncbi:Trafficking protein particle complex subunit 12 [Strongyloides ratti]|uniref:Trafficking protein particle complex subunit 12 n=1 Tax=Strongyloides ratti TaxID=34506 RepID=A0A090LDF7_STRRB|nr:Trafficking protein particle complex subunit 12 [Strongyloides ratti]CEF67787.1 Trafficking protein particle complex subunit 12 [Strongyloides ratti]
MADIKQLFEKRHLYVWVNSNKIGILNASTNPNPPLNSNISFLFSKNIHILPDTIKDVACSLLNKTLSRPVVSEDINGINELIKTNHFRSAANLCQKLIVNILCHAEYLKYSLNPWDCIPRINQLENNVKKVIKFLKNNNEAENFIDDWNKRLLSVELMKARTLYFLKQTRLSFEVYNGLLLSTKEENLKKQILQMLTRLAIVIGDEKTMEKYIKELNPQSGATQYYLHKCLRAIFNGNYSYAQEQLQNISRTNDTDPTVINNLAVSLLYNGNPTESIETIKKYKEIPTEVMFANIHTLSELVLSNCEDEKQFLFSKWADKLPDGYNVQEMKLLQPK